MTLPVERSYFPTDVDLMSPMTLTNWEKCGPGSRHGATMRRAPLTLMTIVALTFLAAPLLSHHSMATYDQTTLISINGVVSKIEWRNPHSWITLTVTNADGKKTAQRIEIAGPRALIERGFDRTA